MYQVELLINQTGKSKYSIARKVFFALAVFFFNRIRVYCFLQTRRVSSSGQTEVSHLLYGVEWQVERCVKQHRSCSPIRSKTILFFSQI